MVDGNPDRRSRGTLPGLQPRRGVAAARVADPVCGFRGLAERRVAGRCAGTTAWILAEAIGRNGRSGAADRSPTTGNAEPSRGESAFGGRERIDGETKRTRSARGHD